MNAPGLNFTGIHARSPETTATRRHDLGPLADRRRGNPARIALHRRRTAGGRRIRRPPPPARIPGLACAVARAAARSTRGARSGRRSRISFSRHPARILRRTYREGSRTGKIAYGPTPACTKTPDPKTFHSNTPGSATRCKRESSPRCATSASAIRTATRRSFSLRSLARWTSSLPTRISPARRGASSPPQEQALQPCALPEALFPALVWCAKEAVYKWVRISGLSLLHDIRITEIHPETTRTNPSGTGFPALEAFHRLTVTAAGKTLQLHGFTVEGICCVYGIG